MHNEIRCKVHHSHHHTDMTRRPVHIAMAEMPSLIADVDGGKGVATITSVPLLPTPPVSAWLASIWYDGANKPKSCK